MYMCYYLFILIILLFYIFYQNFYNNNSMDQKVCNEIYNFLQFLEIFFYF